MYVLFCEELDNNPDVCYLRLIDLHEPISLSKRSRFTSFSLLEHADYDLLTDNLNRALRCAYVWRPLPEGWNTTTLTLPETEEETIELINKLRAKGSKNGQARLIDLSGPIHLLPLRSEDDYSKEIALWFNWRDGE